MNDFGLDISNPNSIAYLVTDRIREHISKIPEELLNLSEEILVKKCYPDGVPTIQDWGIKQNFWLEYHRALGKQEDRMNIANVCEGVCRENQFYKIIEFPERLAYIISQPSDFKKTRRHLLNGLHLQFQHIITLPVVKGKKVDTRLISLKLELFKFLYAYEHGAPIQHIKQENTNLNVDVQKAQLSPRTIEDIDKELSRMGFEVIEKSQSLPPNPPMGNKLALPVESVVKEAGRITEDYKLYERKRR